MKPSKSVAALSPADPANAESPDLRFRFGDNWTRFLSVVDEERIRRAEGRLTQFLADLRGKSFLDVGCGSGIHSLAALRLGAKKVISFDFDPQSVECSRELRRRYGSESDWRIESGSALDERYVRSLGSFDIVYSWGVLHHTGDMWRALDLVAIPARERLMIAIYNDQGWRSKAWWYIKRRYVRSGPVGRKALEVLVFFLIWGRNFIENTLLLRPQKTVRAWRDYSENRGMSAWRDVVDWAGGYPYEVATSAAIKQFYAARGFQLEGEQFSYGYGCNEFLFRRLTSPKT